LNIYDNENARKLSLTIKDECFYCSMPPGDQSPGDQHTALINSSVINCPAIKRPVIKAPRTSYKTLTKQIWLENSNESDSWRSPS